MSEDKGRVFGYARVSSREQNLDRQILALSQYVPDGFVLYDSKCGTGLDYSKPVLLFLCNAVINCVRCYQ